MMLRTLLNANSLLAVVSGAACVLIPARILAWYDVSLSQMGLVIYQFWGATLIGLGMLIWIARQISDSVLRRRLAAALFITNSLSCVMAIRGQFAGANSLGWSMVGFFSLLALGFGIAALQEQPVGDPR